MLSKPIKFWQYLPTEGRFVKTTFNRHADLAGKAVEAAYSSRGYFCYQPIAKNGGAALSFIVGEETHDSEVSETEPEIPLAIDRLVERVHASICGGAVRPEDA